METCGNLKHHFLIAMPMLREGIFAHSLTYICEHTDAGAMGLVLNHPLDLTLNQIFEHLELDIRRPCHQPVLAGGPVQTERGFVLHPPQQGEWEATLVIVDTVALTTSTDIITALAAGTGPEDALVALGYAGWGAGQLEEELAANAWLTLPADERILFHTPVEQRLPEAARRLGVDLSLIASQAGHA